MVSSTLAVGEEEDRPIKKTLLRFDNKFDAFIDNFQVAIRDQDLNTASRALSVCLTLADSVYCDSQLPQESCLSPVEDPSFRGQSIPWVHHESPELSYQASCQRESSTGLLGAWIDQ